MPRCSQFERGSVARRLAGRLAAFLIVAAPSVAFAAKTDVVVLLNGDRFTGEIKGLSRAKLDFSTDDAGRMSIEWTKVASITSIHVMEIETTDGHKYWSPLTPNPGGSLGFVRLDDGTLLPIADIVTITPLSQSLLRRLKAYLDLGFTLAKANNAMTLTSSGEVAYRGERLGAALDFDVYAQKTATSVAVSRESVGLAGDLYFRRWAIQLFFIAEHNDELELAFRLTLGSGAAYFAVKNQEMELIARAGLAALREDYFTQPPANYLASYATIAWEAFKYDSPKLDTGISVTAYPYLTDPGRVRLESSARVKYEIFSDFDVGLSISDSFDSRPPDPGASNNDYLVTFTIGWSYRR